MSHLHELDEPARSLHDRITAVLAKQGQPAEPASIIQAVCQTIHKLLARGQCDEVRRLLSILTAHRDSLVYSELTQSVVMACLEAHTSLALSVLKSCLRNGRPADLSQITAFLEERTALPSVRNVLVNHLHVPAERLRAGDSVALSCAKSGDKSQFVAHLEAAAEKSESLNEPLVEYLKNTGSLSNEEILRIIASVPLGSSLSHEALVLLLGFNRRNCAAHQSLMARDLEAEPLPSIFTSEFAEMLSNHVRKLGDAEKKVEDFVSLFWDDLYPRFASMVTGFCDSFREQGLFVSLLRKILNRVGLDVFLELIEPMDLKKHALLLRGINNCDIDSFLDLYNGLREDGKLDEVGHLLSCLPSFCNYCTDHSERADELMQVLKAHVRTQRNFVCAAIERLIHSHRLNLTSTLVLPSPIPREHSVRILSALKACGLFDGVAEAFLDTDNNECDRALEMMVELTGADLAEELAGVILRPETSRGISLYGALKLMTQFAHKWRYSYDLIAELLQLRHSAENNIQKRAYYLLSALCSAQQVPCFCDLLFSNAAVHPCATRNRLMLLHAIARRGCADCKCENMQERFFAELTKYAKNGNVKARKFAREIVLELVNHAAFRAYLLAVLNVAAEDQDLVNGVLEAVHILLEHIGGNQEYQLKHGLVADGEPVVDTENPVCVANTEFINALFGRIAQVGFSSEELVRQTIRNFCLMYSVAACRHLSEEISALLSKYIVKYNKKFNRDLRDAVYAAKEGGHRLTKEMSLLLKFKNKGGAPKEIQVLKNRNS
ncbi:hypothetical protein PAPHI01_0863 [Pancytospora philotis]|nr:hypothetical protein PAPHI01_0863 [Pancytospora philotis]